MNAENDNLRPMEGREWVSALGAEILFQTPEPGTATDPGYFVVTYNFQPAATRNFSYPGIRELESPLSDY
jgi:hypothetical protein